MAIFASIPSDSITQDVRRLAGGLGFPLCGFTTPDPPEGYTRYERWLEAGMHGGMGYLSSDRARRGRADPRAVLPDARSIVVLGAPHARPPAGAAEGRIAAYALGEDYHDVLPARLRALCRMMDELTGQPHAHRVYTDAGPILERELAVRAGLGWIGRNSMLIHPRLGSFFFLAEILTSISFVPDLPFAADRCGTCDRCIRACPTGCIQPDRTLDARRCLSYLTIEHRGAIPEDLRPMLGNWVFGCDICQLICPWNSKPVPAPDSAFAARPFLPVRDLAAELALGGADLESRFRGSPLRRAGIVGYRRNLILAAGNSGRADTAAILRPLAEDTDPVLRDAADWGLRRTESLRKLR
jgi:epoxyqueuosine reductase